MFEYVKLKNYRSLVDTEINLLNKDGSPKHIVLIYGRNGIGKSNLASAFFTLAESFRTMNVKDIVESILSEDPKRIDDESFKNYIKDRYKDIETIISANKTISSDEPMYMEFGFVLKGEKRGKYILEMNNDQIIHERLEYVLAKNKIKCFDIKSDNGSRIIDINKKLSIDTRTYKTIFNACEKYWGKHSLLSIIFYEEKDKADNYIKDNLNQNFYDVLEFFLTLSCKLKLGNRGERGLIGLPSEIIHPFDHGKIPLSKEKLLNNAEKMLNTFFTSIFTDIKEAYYDKKIKNDFIIYRLFFKKEIAGKIRDIDFSLESTGIQSLLDILPFLLVGVNGSVTIIDEFDIGLHSILVRNTIDSLLKKVDGQIILITHATQLMNSNLPDENTYLIHEFIHRKKSIVPITYNNKIHKNANVVNQYLSGHYSGVPEKVDIDFPELYSILDA